MVIASFWYYSDSILDSIQTYVIVSGRLKATV